MAKVKIGKFAVDSAELEREHEEAVRRGAERLAREPRAESVTYDSKADRIRIELSNGCTFMFPPHIAQGLRGATAEELSDVEIYGGGLDLHWGALDAQFDVTILLAGLFGTRKWMDELSSIGGVAADKADSLTARENDEHHDRPRAKKTA